MQYNPNKRKALLTLLLVFVPSWVFLAWTMGFIPYAVDVVTGQAEPKARAANCEQARYSYSSSTAMLQLDIAKKPGVAWDLNDYIAKARQSFNDNHCSSLPGYPATLD
jgi:hypothetical protein